ncbi:hypothetical protein [Lactobacillus sp.]
MSKSNFAICVAEVDKRAENTATLRRRYLAIVDIDRANFIAI